MSRSIFKMKKRMAGILAAAVIILGLGFILYNQAIPNAYEPADD